MDELATANHHFSSGIDGGAAAAGDQEQQSAVAVSSSPPPRRQRNGSLSPFPVSLSLSLMDCGRVKDGAAERVSGRGQSAPARCRLPPPLSLLSLSRGPSGGTK